jgi:hypothetical protein
MHKDKEIEKTLSIVKQIVNKGIWYEIWH